MTPGQLAFKSMFHQAITNASDRIHPLFGKPHTTPDGRVESEILITQTGAARPLGVYLADLYMPSGRKPFRTVQAGRELLDPSCLSSFPENGAFHN